ncbi:hypothetical protein Ancab_002518 [Ancistrocladus abbreviatus]
MAEFFPYNTSKRKDHEDPSCDLSLSSPSNKIRRLDCFASEGGQSLADNLTNGNNGVELALQDSRALMQPENDGTQETALVLYNPPIAALYKLPDSFDFPIVLNSDLIPELKYFLKIMEGESYGTGSGKSESTSNNLAIVPWVETQLPSASTASYPSEQMDAEDADMMETEDISSADGNNREMFKFGGLMRRAEGFQHCQQQQQHCTTPQLLQNKSNQVAWSW